MAFYLDNAISWALHRLRGGWKNLFIISGWYTVAAVVFITIPYELTDTYQGKMFVLQASSVMLLVIQVLMMLLLCAMSVVGTIRRDIAAHLLESHRLMPLSPVQAVLGYIAGGSLHILSLCFINLIVGIVLFGLRGVPVLAWLIPNGLLFGFSVSIWTAMAMAAFTSRAILGWLIIMLAGITISGGYVFIVLPGLLAFCSPMQGQTIFEITSMARLTNGTMVALFAQFLFALIFVRGAARKYADGNALSLPPGPSLAILGIWAGLTWFGIADFWELRPRSLAIGPIDPRIVIIGGIASCLLVSLIPLGAMAWSEIIRRQRGGNGRSAAIRAAMLAMSISVCLLFILIPLTAKDYSALSYNSRPYLAPRAQAISPPPSPKAARTRANSNVIPQPAWQTNVPPVQNAIARTAIRPDMIAAVCAIFLVDIYLMMRLLYPAIRRANALILFLIGFWWFAPVYGDVIYYGLKNVEPKMDLFALLSPIGIMAQAVDHPVAGTWRGIAAQGVGCLLLVILLWLVQSRRDRRDFQPIGLAADL